MRILPQRAPLQKQAAVHVLLVPQKGRHAQGAEQEMRAMPQRAILEEGTVRPWPDSLSAPGQS